MSIRQRGNSWQVDVYSPTGSRYRRQFTERDAAETWELKTKLAFTEGNPLPDAKFAGPPPPTTLEELIARTAQKYWKDAKSWDTIKCNLNTLTSFFGKDRKLEDIDNDAVEMFTVHLEDEKRYPPSTINRKLAVLSRVLVYAERRGWIANKPAIDRKKEEYSRVRFYSLDERNEIESAFRDLDLPEYANLFLFLCDTGLRLGEALDLRWVDCDNGRVTIWQHKGSKPGAVPTTKRVDSILAQRTLECGNLEGPWADMTKHTARYAWSKVRSKLGKGDDSSFVWHTCRHTFCSRLVQAGVPLKSIQDLARHQAVETTIRYSHLAPKDYESAIATLEDEGGSEE